ncbi:MAG: RNase adapter RapZ [Rhodospirillales bacterium]|jgi:UPF0042 nucleotide-binding protein|nr:RNase adapter RapZ [Rhodospirillales bacterium]
MSGSEDSTRTAAAGPAEDAVAREAPAARRFVLVTGLSGAGKASVLHALEDLGYTAIDNPPLPMLEETVRRTARRLAVGIDARSQDFSAANLLAALDRLRAEAGLQPEMVYVWAEAAALLRRYTATRRRHPLAPEGRVADGIAEEQALTAPLRAAADMVIDTSDLPLPAMRRLVERHFAAGQPAARLVVTLVSFAYPQGLPHDADLVFDARFLRNPHYDPALRPGTGLDPEIGDYVAADPACAPFLAQVGNLLDMLLPRFVQEGKKYVTIAVGCTGGRHRSVYITERLAVFLAGKAGPDGVERDWRLHVAHRELAREGHASAYLTDRHVPSVDAR